MVLHLVMVKLFQVFLGLSDPSSSAAALNTNNCVTMSTADFSSSNFGRE
jgi:hypothetical protein